MDIFDHESPVAGELSPRLATALQHIEFSLRYTHSLLEDLTEKDWYWTPENYTTHIAWQVGHITMAIYGLTLFMQRGRESNDSELMSGKFRKKFMKGTKPVADREFYPSPEEIRDTLERVRSQMLKEFPSFDGDQLDEPSQPPHSAHPTRYGVLMFAGDHTMLHAGQIGMLRRLMGKAPLR